jgi:Ser/Thr protein kinase RdoA (MazF antagonist)
VTHSSLDAWCRRWLGATVDDVLFTAGHLSRVIGVRLHDGRDVVVKVRPAADRLAGCADVQRALYQAGFPCSQPLVGLEALDGFAASAEVLVPGGEVLDLGGNAVELSAELLARFIRLAPAPSSVRSLEPNPPWVAWDHHHDGLWPPPDDRDVDLNAHVEPAWLEEAGRRVRQRLQHTSDWPSLVGHGDWEAQNLRWNGRQPWVVHDWDSVMTGPEAVIVGLAASVWPCGAEPRAASIDESAAFIKAYQRAAGRRWGTDEEQASWAAGLWVYAFNTKRPASTACRGSTRTRQANASAEQVRD